MKFRNEICRSNTITQLSKHFLFISSPLHVSLIAHYSIAVLFQDVLLFYVHIVSSVSSACGPNEEFRMCGPSPSCEPTCAKPHVDCPEVSIIYIYIYTHFSWSWKLSCLRLIVTRYSFIPIRNAFEAVTVLKDMWETQLNTVSQLANVKDINWIGSMDRLFLKNGSF